MPRIGIYTIALNEEQFAERWANSAKDADHILVADTGSTDETVSILRNTTVNVQPLVIRPWRFDDARNAALALMPADLDIVIALDMDEVMVPDWRVHVERHWTSYTTRLRYPYVWNWTAHNQPDVVYYSEKITGRFTHRWKHAVHEVLAPTVPEVTTTCEVTLVEHHADVSKPRGQYLPLLKIAVEEDPSDDRNAHYLGREYYFNGQYQTAIIELHRHLQLPRAQWKAERAASMRYIGKCHEQVGDFALAQEWFVRATLEDANSREALVDAARFALTQKMYHMTIAYCLRAIVLPAFSRDYMAERYARHEGAFDLMSVAYWHIGQFTDAVTYATEAVNLNPHDPRLVQNLKMMQGACPT